MITQDTIDRVAEAADILTVISDSVELKQRGNTYIGCCPFHNEKTPSFNVNVNRQYFKCFGCGKGGNVFTFVMELKRFSYPETIKYLANKFNVTVEYDSSHTKEEETESKKADKIFAISQEYFIKSVRVNEAALKYLSFTRRFSDETIAEWGLGYAPKDFNGLFPKFTEDGLMDVAESIGLVKRNEQTQKSHDVYIDRITIPIRNSFGRLIGYGGRLLHAEPENKFPKYINPKDSKFYHKENLLFGFDKARTSISKFGYAILVEGYFDVISMHDQGARNTVSICGTAFTEGQAKLLRKSTEMIVVSLDNDGAGIKALHKLIPIALPLGFRIETFTVEGFKDPDEWIKTMDPYQEEKDKKPAILETIEATKKDALLAWFDAQMNAAGTDSFETIKVIESFAYWLALIPKEIQRNYYVTTVCKKHRDVKLKDLKKAISDALEKIEVTRQAEERRIAKQQGVPEEYKLPAEIQGSVPWSDIRNDVEQYSVFIAKNKVYSLRGSESFHFKEVSNFSIKIIQHMEDERFPMKLVQIENVHGRKRTFDAPSENFTSADAFVKTITNFGNFNWQGDKMDYQRLITKLYDEMGDGRMINVLGWQEENFFAFCNAIVFTNGTHIEVDKFGCFSLNGASYYIPAGNSIHQANPNLFMAQKRVVFKPAKVSIEDFFKQIIKVHRSHGKNAILFTIASLFSDIIVDRLSFFPMLFLYGEASSGKDNLIECCQSFFGKTQTALTITGRANTDKAKIRKFAQMRNMIVHMSEYKNGNEDTDLLLMGLWDRRGYERANLDSGVGTESVPILSSVIFTGNEYPVYDPLITRFIAEEMNKNDFTDQEKREYEVLKEMLQAGVSSFVADMLKMRSEFDMKFRQTFKEVSADLKAEYQDLNLADRMTQNAAVLGATLRLSLENGLPIPFTMDEWKKYMRGNMERQSNKRSTGDAVSKWWDCILDSCRTGKELIAGRDYRIDGTTLFINFKTAYNFYAQTHFKLFRSAGLSKASMMDKLKKNTEQFLGEIESVRFGSAKSSAYRFNLEKIGIYGDLINILEHLQAEANHYKSRAKKDESDQEHDTMAGIENSENAKNFAKIPEF